MNLTHVSEDSLRGSDESSDQADHTIIRLLHEVHNQQPLVEGVRPVRLVLLGTPEPLPEVLINSSWEAKRKIGTFVVAYTHYRDMKKILYIWNRLYYGHYYYNRWSQILFYRIFGMIPNRFLYRLGILNKEKYARVNKEAVRSLTNEKVGPIVLISDATMLAFTALILWSIANFTALLIPSASPAMLNRETFILITAIVTIPINYFTLWKKDRYIEYFIVFRKSSSLRNRIWSIISISTMILALLLFILSMYLMGVAKN